MLLLVTGMLKRVSPLPSKVAEHSGEVSGLHGVETPVTVSAVIG